MPIEEQKEHGVSRRDDTVRTAPDHDSIDTPGGEERPGDREVWDAVVDVFERAAETQHVAELVGRINHTVSLRSRDLPEEELIIEARDGRLEVLDAPADGRGRTIELALATKDLERLSHGHLRTAMAIAGGRATYSGPVREFLRVLPLVQAMVNPPVPMGTNAAQDEEF